MASGDTRQFREATKRDALNNLKKELEKILSAAPASQYPTVKKDFDGFTNLFERFIQEEGPSIEWEKIQRLQEGSVRQYDSLDIPNTELVHEMLQKLVVVKLNGGLGTSMGCYGPKSVITVRNDLTFLDLTVQQIEVMFDYMFCILWLDLCLLPTVNFQFLGQVSIIRYLILDI